MNILVAGGAGFIGSNLIDALLKNGHDVVCIDNYFIGTKQNIAHLLNHPNFIMIEQDICNVESLKKIFEQYAFDYVFHLAANSDIQASANQPMIECHNTYLTTFTLLECMRLYNVKRFFFASTSAVYGDKNGENVSENCPELMPISYYGGAKLGSEAIISAYTYMNDMNTLIFRFPNVIGPRLTHGVIFDFIKRLRVEPDHLRILGDGRQSKPYIYVSDLVDAILHFMDSPKGITLYNVGVEGRTNVTHIAEIIIKKMGLSNVKLEYTGGTGGWKGDVPVFQYDLTKIHEAGWKANFTSDESVEKTVEWAIR